MEFKVIGVEKFDGGAKVKLEAHHPGRAYLSQLFLHVPWSEVKEYPIDSKHMLFPCLSTEIRPICDGPTLQAMRRDNQ